METDRIKYIQSFTGGMNTVLAPKLLPPEVVEYMLNCNVFSSAEGNVGIVTNTKGTTEVPVDLPAGTNKTIGWASDEERNNLYYFVYNSAGYHGIYRYNSVDNAVIRIMQCIDDTGGVDIFKWEEKDRILGANVISNNLLYWTVYGVNRHPARKINVDKALDRSETGYNGVIKEVYTRAYKRTSVYPPRAEYFTDDTKKFNRVYGRLFKFAIRYGYDDGEWSNWSSFSSVPTPDFERYSGSLSVPLENNGIHIYINTGSAIVKRIEVAMMSTNPEGGFLPWGSIIVIDKDALSIGDYSDYVYDFYNDGYTDIVGDQAKVYRNYSYLPKAPRCQEFTNNALIYANFHEGFPVVKVDVDTSVRYEDLFIDDEVENKLNEPSIEVINRNSGSAGIPLNLKYIEGDLVIGSDVKNNNNFVLTFYDANYNPLRVYSVIAKIGDTSITIANKFASRFKETMSQGGLPDPVSFEYVDEVETDLSGNSHFRFKFWGLFAGPEIVTNVNPVDYDSLKNAGQSIQNIKLGSSVGYAIVYFDDDGRKSAGYRGVNMTVAIDSINSLGAVKKPIVSLYINHEPPKWAPYYQIVRTDDLVYGNYIQMLIQQTVNYSEGSDEYIDLVVGSLFSYQNIHPNSTLRYEFKRGDRVRLVKKYNGTDWDIPAESKDFEVLAYYPTVEEQMDEDITVDGTSTVTVATATTDNIGNYVRVNSSDREIVGVPDGTHYELSAPLTSGDPVNETKTFPSYTIINNRGVIRIKSDPDNPIEADPENNTFPLVEIYSPSIGHGAVDEDIYYEFGQVYPILGYGTDTPYHGGSVQDQNAGQPAIVEISSGTSYVRYRELPTSSNVDNPQVLVTEIEDPSYSDFYVSDMNDNGKSIPLDRGDGEVLFDERMRFSNNYIQGTRINGLNDFDNLDRKDYNDKYGAIERIWYEEGILVVFKHLKDAWASIFGSIIVDQTGSELLAKSDQLLPDKLQYYAWDGGVGDNPESVARLGTQYFHVSPNSMIVARLGGNGVDPISKMYGVDPTVRRQLSSAKKAGALIHGGSDRHNGKYDVSIEQHDNVISDTPFSEAGWQNDIEELPGSGVTYSIVTGPSHGTLTGTSDTPIYTPDSGYSGPDTFSYELFIGGVSQGIRNVCLDVVYQEGPKAWRPIGQICIIDHGNRTGYQGWSTLEQYDTYHGTATGVTKPNVPGDPDYVAPVYDPVACEPEEEFLLFVTTSTDASFTFDLYSGSTDVIIEARNGLDVIDTTSPSSSDGKTLDLSGSTGDAYIWVRGAVGFNEDVVRCDAVSRSVTSIFPQNFPSLTYIDFGDNDISSVNLSGNTLLTIIRLNGNNLSALDVSANTIVTSLDASNNNISSLSLVSNVDLEFLEVDFNSISTLSLATNVNLLWCLAGDNNLSTISFANNPLLIWIRLNNNSLITIDTSFCPALTRLEAKDNTITSFDFSSNPLIEVLDIGGNDLTALVTDGLTQLNTLYVSDNPTGNVDLSDNTLLEAVQISGNSMTVFDISMLTALVALDITLNDLSTFSIASNDNLTDLRCGENPFTADDALPGDVDAIIIKMDSNIISGGALHYDTLVPGGVQPSAASLAAYNSLVSKGTSLQGKVPV